MSKTAWTYDGGFRAQLAAGRGGRDSIGQVGIPDQVYRDQHAYNGRTFRGADGRRYRLRGDWYGLDTPGTGEITVQRIG